MQKRNHFIAGTIINYLQKKKNKQTKNDFTDNVQSEKYIAHYKTELFEKGYQLDQSNGAIIDWLLDRQSQKR
jgi:hypothetical protein